MIDLSSFKDMTVAVFGLARSGLAAAEALRKGRANVWAWDDSEEHRHAAAARGISLVDLYQQDLRKVCALILSPGVPLHYPKPHPIVIRARQANIEIIGDIDLLGRAQKAATYIGITGTNGKSTTTALVGHILTMSGQNIEVGGNLGIPVLSLRPLTENGTYVLEMSSYQLDLTSSVVFDVGVLLNITPDHLDRHGDMTGYTAAKERIFKNQNSDQIAIIGVDDPICRNIYDRLTKAAEQKIIPISVSEKLAGGVYVQDGVIIDNIDNDSCKVISLNNLTTLLGKHNWQNAAAAYAVAKTMSVAPEDIAMAVGSYPGLAHRQERVAYVDDILYVNDSKATNIDSAARALICYANIYWIAGGRSKEGGFEALTPLLKNIRAAYLIGEAAPSLAAFLKGKVTFYLCKDLASAVARAHEDAQQANIENAVVLLSPACASLDQFKDFEDRGHRFRKIVDTLPGKHRAPDRAEIAA
ncbi:MAG: UDP-N-acetylmuramoyl-L-alanine--D-glutamate ligase [Alphaproteobacteria bacterium]